VIKEREEELGVKSISSTELADLHAHCMGRCYFQKRRCYFQKRRCYFQKIRCYFLKTWNGERAMSEEEEESAVDAAC
jgi:hypothetical protein